MELFIMYVNKDIVDNNNNNNIVLRNRIVLTCFGNWNIFFFCKLWDIFFFGI